jgi:imidazolonepropionase-like amidohydrolase
MVARMMKHAALPLAATLSLALNAPLAHAQQMRTIAIAIVHAHAFPVVTPPVDDATIIIAQGRIVSIVAHGPVPAGADSIDAQDHSVTPGLFGSATQLGLGEVSEAADTNDQVVTTGPLGPAFDTQYALNRNSALIAAARADGVTRAMSYPGGAATVPFAGQGALLHLVTQGPILAQPHAAMFVVVGNAGLAQAGGSRAAQWVLLRNDLTEARHFTATQTGPRDQLLDRPDVEALVPVIAGTMPLVISAERESDIRQAIALASDMHIRVVILGGAEAWRAAEALAAAHIPVILDPEANMPQTFDSLGARLDNAALLARAGVTIAFSVSGNGIYRSYDTGISEREGAGLAVANGLLWSDALRAITLAPAEIWGVPNAGKLAPGADADLVIWDGDPLEPASAPVMVMIGGEKISLTTRQTELRDRYAPASRSDPLPPAYRP